MIGSTIQQNIGEQMENVDMDYMMLKKKIINIMTYLTQNHF